MNFLSRFQIDINHFTQSEIAAQAKAVAITTEIKNLLASKTALTIEAITGTSELGAATLAVVTEGLAILTSPAVIGIVTAVEDALGDLGARLTAAIHEGAPIVSGIGHWIFVFEALFSAAKKEA